MKGELSTAYFPASIKELMAAKVAKARRLLAIMYRILRDKDSFKVYKKDIGKKAGSPSHLTNAA